MDLALAPFATYMGQKEFVQPPIPVAGFQSADWWENDGAVSTYSQQYPRVSGAHSVGGEVTADTPVEQMEPGRWYYQWERGVDHLDICVFPELIQIGWQRRFYTALYQRLAAL